MEIRPTATRSPTSQMQGAGVGDYASEQGSRLYRSPYCPQRQAAPIIDIACAAHALVPAATILVLSARSASPPPAAIDKSGEQVHDRGNQQLIEDGMAIGGNPDTVSRVVEKWAKAGMDQMIFLCRRAESRMIR